MSDCDVCVYVDSDSSPDFFDRNDVKARKPHKCCECGRVIGNNILAESTLPWQAESRRIWSLWEMIEHVCMSLCAELQRLLAEIDYLKNSKRPASPLSALEKDRIAKVVVEPLLKEAYKLKFLEIDPPATSNVFRISQLHSRLTWAEKITPAAVGEALSTIYNDFVLKLMELKFAYIPPPNDKYFEQDKLFGGKVFDVFSNARDDIKDAGNCLAAGLHTACVFHVVRIAEHGLRALAAKVNVQTVLDKGEDVPLEYGDWNKVSDAIGKRIGDARILANNAEKEGMLIKFSEAKERLIHVRDIWRNNLSHTRKRYNADEAKAAFGRLKDFMEFLGDTLEMAW